MVEEGIGGYQLNNDSEQVAGGVVAMDIKHCVH